MGRGQVDHPAPARFAHERCHGRGVKGRGQHDRDDGVPLTRREFIDGRDMLNACVVDEDIAAASLGDQCARGLTI